jgi:hypothetical protein
MRITAGESRRNISSGSIEHAGAAALFCILTGAVSVGIDVAFHIPLHMPGHHGLTQMALLVIAALVTRRPWAATLSALSSAALAVPVFGLDPLAPSLYLLSGVVVDALVFAGRAFANRAWFWGILGGLGNLAKAIELWVMGSATHGHLHLGSLVLSGVGFSLISHLVFGAVGGWLAAQIWLSSKASRTRGD